MSTLHLAFSTAGLDAARLRCGENDAILLIGDGVYAAHNATDAMFALEEDLTIRGVSPSAAVTVVDYAGMVELTTEHHPLVSWRE